jgi:PAS domain S-box-containing protein
VTLKAGLEAFESSEEFDGPVEDLDGHHYSDHFAHIYESDADRFAAAVPFVRHGLERGERVMYVLDESSEAEVRTALHNGGIDVDTPLDSGALSFHAVQDTYLRNGSFDSDEMIEYYGDTIETATEEYEALRIVAETTWLQADATPVEEFMKYEAKINDVLADAECLALCQYDRDGFPAEVVHDIVRTHPHLIHDGAVSHNVYYTPPAEFLAGDDPEREVDRILGTLREHTESKTALRQRDRFLRELHAITADKTRSFDEKVHALLDLGCEQFGLDVGGVNRVDPGADYFEVEYLNGDHELFEPGAELPLSQTYCQATADIEEAANISKPADEGLDDILVFDEFGIQGYIGTYIPVDGGMDRTLGFVPAEDEPVSVSEEDRACLELMGQWISYELNRRQRERELSERTEHLRALVETAPDCIKTVAADGTLLQMNPAGLAMARVDSESDMVGKCVYDWVAPEHRRKYREFNERICRGEGGSLEFDVIGTDGTRRHMESHAAPLQRPDGTTAQVALTRDVTERKERERELERYERLAENLPVGVYRNTPGPDGEFVEVNDTLASMFGADSEAELLECNVSDLYSNPEERAELSRRLEREGIVEGVELKQETLDGEQIWISVTAMRTEEDGEVFFDGIVQDITEREERKQQLQEQNDRLESFASLLAHELRNPISIGQIYSQQLPDEADTEAVEYVTEAFDRIEDMVDVMLILTRGREAVGEYTPVALAEVARKAWDSLDTSDASFDIEIDRTIQADETYSLHLFRNLLENAVEHGGEDVTVTAGELRDGFYVADDGAGIPPAERDAIFDEGYTTAADNGGTGLGLAFVQKLAEVYDWDYAVTESADGGARFEFRNVA